MVGRQRRAPAAPNAKHLLRRGAAKLGRLGRDNGGSVVVLAGFLFPVVIGGMGLGAETSYWYWTQRKLQHAADVSVYAAAVRAGQGERNSSKLYDVAFHVAKEADFIPGGLNEPDKTVEVVPYNGTATQHHGKDSVEVVVTETLPLLLTSIFTGEPLTLTGRAIAIIEYGANGCVLALSKTKARAVSLSGSTNVELSGCDVASNSNASDAFDMQGSSKLTTGCVHSAGGVSATTGLTLTDEQSGAGPCKDGPRDYGPSIADPYADVADPEVEGVFCDPNKVTVAPPQTETFTPTGSHSSGMKSMCFGNGLDLKGTVTFMPGIYFITGGDFNINSTATVSGVNVTFVLLNGASMSFNGGATIDLAAPVHDPLNPGNPYEGILFFSDRASTTTHTINGDSSSKFTGAIYAPTSAVQYAGGGSSTGACTQIIGDTVTFTGSSEVGSNCTGTGVRNMKFGQQIAIVE